MFNNILYFIIVLLIFNINYQESKPQDPLSYTVLMVLLTGLILAGYSRWGFHRLWERWKREGGGDGAVTGDYHRLILRLSVFSILLFALDVHLFHLKYWLQAVPGFQSFSVLQGVLALAVFLGYLATIWTFAYPVYVAIFGANVTRRAFLISHFKFNLPILFPWVVLTLVHDLISLVPWKGIENLQNSPGGQIVFFACFLSLLMVFMPRFIQTWWGCRPFPLSGKVRDLETFLRERDFRYRRLLQWPLFEGRILTAGIMGLVPRYRYILVTDGLMEALSVEELKAVLAHEMGHARYRHMLFYLIFLLGYMVLSFGIFDVSFYLLAVQPFFVKILESGESQGTSTFYLVLSLPLLGTMFLYFRYVMGFFMRHFERQADLFSAVTMGGPRETISSLEKIAFLSGKIRDLPSWHHFSIRERVECLTRFISDPGVFKRHNRFLRFSFAGYLACMLVLVYVLHFSAAKENMTLGLVGKVLHEQLAREPHNVDLYQNLAMVYHRLGKLKEAMEAYEKILELDDSQAVALNNLAWLLVTVPDQDLRNPKRALNLAEKAVALKRSPVFLDTLAEAYYANGLTREAVETIREAISRAEEGVDYYERQLKKFTTMPKVGT
ncbi:MAG: M48 family metalloprotease [Deltaproteobacteria bacterium]|nr:M48 family metalloprotease [Deltaproteobacteria bacterium]